MSWQRMAGIGVGAVAGLFVIFLLGRWAFNADKKADVADGKVVAVMTGFDDFKASTNNRFTGVEQGLTGLKNAVNELANRPAVTVAPAPAVVATPAYLEPVPVATATLLRELESPDAKGVAMDAALRLVRRPEAVQDIVEAYASGNAETKKRTRWVLLKMGEPARVWLCGAMEHPDSRTPTIVSAVKELFGTFSDAPSATGRGPNEAKVSKIETQVNALTQLALAQAKYNAALEAYNKGNDKNRDSLAEEVAKIRQEINDLRRAVCLPSKPYRSVY